MKIDTRFKRGDEVFLVTDVDQLPRLVVAIVVSEDVRYIVAQGTSYSEHSEIELSNERRIF